MPTIILKAISRIFDMPYSFKSVSVALFFFSLLSSMPASCQVTQKNSFLDSARDIVDTLCSPTMAGRGYNGGGHKVAAQFIANQFRKIGLKTIEDAPDYFQAFDIQINQAKHVVLKVGKKELVPGEDFIVNMLSGSGRGNYNLLDLGFGLNPDQNVQGKVVVFQDGLPENWDQELSQKKEYQGKGLENPIKRILNILNYQPAGIIIKKSKLTAAFAKQTAPIPILEVRDVVWPDKAKSIYWEVEAEMARFTTQNVAALLQGSSGTDTTILVCAHYDHLGKLEESYFPGANDNASGIAMLLSLANYFADKGGLKYDLIFVAFGAEETGLDGSRYYVHSQPLHPLKKTRFVLNLDLMGNGDEGITAVAAYEFPEEYKLLEEANNELSAVDKITKRKNRPNSDHYFFVEKGVPAFFIFTLGGPPHYHDVNDKSSNLLFSRFEEVRSLLIRFLEKLDQN